MKKALGCAALSCALGLAGSKALSRSDDGPEWTPAQETLGYMPSLGMQPPAPTAPPEAATAKQTLQGRDTKKNTCAYVTGDEKYSLYCAATERCIANKSNSHVGCCEDGSSSCPVWTTCYDSTERSRYVTSNGLTLWCGNSSFPHCITHLYQDTALTGYTLFGCAVAGATDKVWATSFPSSTSASSASTSITSTSDSTSTTNPGPINTTPAPSSTPVGPIVGGVVGGLAVIALIIFGIWALKRQSNKHKAASATVPQRPPPPQGPDPMLAQQQQQQQRQQQQQPGVQGYPAARFAPFDPRPSAVKPVGYGRAGTTTNNNNGGNSLASSSTPSPPPRQGQGQGQGQGYRGYGQQQQQGYGGYRGHGQQQTQQTQHHHGYGRY